MGLQAMVVYTRIGKAGNPDTQDWRGYRHWSRAPKPSRVRVSILTAGGFDAHIHFICPQQIEEALMSGVTTMLGGGTGPATGTNATTCTARASGTSHRMLQAADAFPMNIGFAWQGQCVSLPAALEEQVLRQVPDWPETPRGLGDNPRRNRQLPVGCRSLRHSGRDTHGYTE